MTKEIEKIESESLSTLNILLPFCHIDYEQPTPEDVKTVINSLQLSQSDTAKITGQHHNHKGSSIARRWKADIESSFYQPIPYFEWRLLIEKANLTKPIEKLHDIKNLPCALPHAHEFYQNPTPNEIRSLLTLSENLTQRTAALVIGLGPGAHSTIRAFAAPIDNKNHKSIKYSQWRLLLEYTGVVNTCDTQQLIHKNSG